MAKYSQKWGILCRGYTEVPPRHVFPHSIDNGTIDPKSGHSMGGLGFPWTNQVNPFTEWLWWPKNGPRID